MHVDKDIQERLTSPAFKRSYESIEACLLPEGYKDVKHQFDNFHVHDTDIWVCSFPKCGTTWTQEMVWLLAKKLDFEGAKMFLDERFRFLEISILTDFTNLRNSSGNGKIKYTESSIPLLNISNSQRFIKTHLPWDLLPTQLKSQIKKPKIIYVTRDPRDVCVSFYHHQKIMVGTKLTFEEYCELFLEGQVLYGHFWNNVLPFWKLRHEPNILFLKYEEMSKDLTCVIRRVAKFLDRSVSDEDVEKLAKHLNFDSMRKNPAVNKEDVVALRQKIHKLKNNDSNEFLRKGIVGDYKMFMGPAIIRKFDEWIKKNIEGIDYIL